MTSNKSKSFIINYHDACIYEKDLNLLISQTEWLNDACINYQMKRLEYYRECLDGEGNSDSGSSYMRNSNHIKVSHVEFVDPSIVSYLMHQLVDDDDTDEMIGLVESWGLQDRDQQLNLIFTIIPINDNNSGSLYHSSSFGGSGNHWSLLIAIKIHISNELMFFHFDSSQGYNTATALAVSNKIQYMYSLNHNQDESDKRTTTKKQKKEEKARVVECNIPQQKNGHDCGIHTLFHAQILGMMEFITFDDALRDISINNMRDILSNQFQQRINTCLLNDYHNNVNDMTKSLRRAICQDIQNLRKLA